MTADVLFDLSILATGTRVRGIGRYLAELAPALELAARGRGRLRIGFLEQSEWLGQGQVSESASEAIARLTGTPEPEARLRWAYRQRIGTARAARSSGARLLHLGYPNVTPLGDVGCPRLLTCHDLIPLRFPEQYRTWQQGYATGRKWLDRRRYASASHLIAISQATAHDLMQLLGVPARNITVVYNGVSLERFRAEASAADATLRERYGLGDRRLLVYAGDGDFRKNAEGMIAALKLLRACKPSSEFTLVWLGQLAQSVQRSIEAQAEDAGVKNAVKLLGFVSDEDLAAFYRSAYATLFVSRAEGFGYPVLEAMACGSPVITSNLSSLVELAGDIAQTVNPENPAAITDALLHVERSAPARAELAASGRRWASQFSTTRQAEETLDVYERLLV